MINKQLLQKRFSKQATTYDEYASVQKKMAAHLIHQLEHRLINNESSSPQHILEIGCGTGYLTSILLEKFPDAVITAVDLSPGMIDVARKRFDEQKINFICGDIEQLNLDQTFDLIISNATFQWFNHLEVTLQKLCYALKETGWLTFSTFGERTFHELYTSYEQALSKLNIQKRTRLGQSFYSSQHLKKVCQSGHNELPVEVEVAEAEIIESFPSVKAFFKSLKKIGANNSNREAHMQRPSVFKQLISIYENQYSKDDVIPATYHCLFATIRPKEMAYIKANAL
ncbi:MAG TPA: malonyl-ACP O-methyltransferase BioC [Bacillota bacterium]|nr:malonyl-ACP O-methyltransferase BioC [Bacillota bacterium]